MPYPDFLTVEEAASVLRIGRTAAYALASQFEATNGVAGIPVVRVGRLLRVPRARLEALAGGPLTESAPAASAPSLVSGPQRRLRSVRDDGGDQAALPFGSER